MLMRRHLRESKGFRLLIWLTMTQMVFMPGQIAWALPQGANVSAGNVQMLTIKNTMLIRQTTGSAVINWGGFDIDNGETVRFLQPGPGAAVLNRIGGGQSTIAGRLLANGQVYLINPNGILFSSSAKVNVGGLVASGLNMSDRDFFARNLSFSGGGGSVINEGSIRAGKVTLVGGIVDNRGSIGGGSVTLAAGQQSVLIDRALDGKISISVDGVTDPSPTAVDTNQLLGFDGIVIAATNTPDPGRENNVPLWISPETTNGLVYNWGTITAPGQLGGDIQIQGVRVGQYGSVRADSETDVGDGGLINIKANDFIHFSSNSVTTANAGKYGNGGNINIIANGTLLMPEGTVLESRGGSQRGDGGTIETSGHGGVMLGMTPRVDAPNGKNGLWILDPPNFYVDDDGDRMDCDFLFFGCELPIREDGSGPLRAAIPNGGTGYMDVDDLNGYLNQGGMQLRTFMVGGSGEGQIVIENSGKTVNGGPSTFALWGEGTVFIDGAVGGGANMDIIFQSQRQVQINAPVNTGGGYLIVNSGGGSAQGATFVESSVQTGGGHVYLISTNSQVIVRNGGSINAGSGNVMMYAPKDGVIIQQTITAGRITAVGEWYSQNGSGHLNAANDIAVASDTWIDMASGATAASSSGDVLFKANHNADITGLSSAIGAVNVIASSITDAGNSSRDVAGNRALLISTNGSIGSTGNRIDTQLGTLAAVANGGYIQISEADDLTIGAVNGGTITAAFIGSDLSVNTTTNFVMPTLTGLIATASGSIDVTTENGSLTVNGLVVQGGGGPVNLIANGAGSDITINELVATRSGNVNITASDSVTVNDLVAATNSGSINIDGLSGTVTMTANALAYARTGNIRVHAGNDAVTRMIIAEQGNISVSAGDDITVNSNLLAATANRTIDVSAGGDIVMAANAISVAGGNTRYQSGGNATLSMLISTQSSAGITVIAGGSILDANGSNPNLLVGKAVLQAGTGIGVLGAGVDDAIEMGVSNLAATAGSGGINILNAGNLKIGNVSVGAINRVDSSGGVSGAGSSSANGLSTFSNGSIVLGNLGRVDVNSPVSANGTGNIMLDSLTGAAGTNIIITSAPLTLNAAVQSGTGRITLAALGGNIIQNADGDVSTFGSSILVASLSNNIVMANGAETRSSGGGIVYVAKTNVLVGSLNAGTTGLVTVVALEGDILDNGDAHRDVIGGGAQLIAPNGSVGTAGNRIDTSLGRVEGFAGDGGFFLTEDNNITIGEVGTNYFQLVNLDGTLTNLNIPALYVLAASNGDIRVETLNGSITVEAPMAALVADGNSYDVLLDANGGSSDINVNDLILDVQGRILLTAGRGITQTGQIIVQSNGFVWAEAEGGSITMADTGLTFVAKGNIRYHAKINNTVGSLIATTGSVSVLADQSVVTLGDVIGLNGSATVDIEAQAGGVNMSSNSMVVAGDNIRIKGNQNVVLSTSISTGGNVAVISTLGSIIDSGSAAEIIADKAQLTALNGGVGQFGSATNALEIGVNTLAARAGKGGINIMNGGNLTIGIVPAVPVNRVQTTGGTSLIGGSQIAGLITSNGGAMVVAALGAVDVNQIVQANGTGNVLLAAVAGSIGTNIVITDSKLTVMTNVSSSLGNITVATIGGNIEQWATGDISTTNGHIVAYSATNDIVMANGARSVAQNGNILYAAYSNVYLGGLVTGTGVMSVVSFAGDIIDNGDADPQGKGHSAQFLAPLGSVGSVGNRLETDIDNLEAYSGGGGIFITEDDDLVIGGVGAVPFNIVSVDSYAINATIPNLNVLAATNNSDILIDTVQGNVTIQGTVANLDTGKTRIHAGGGGSDLTINGIVVANSGPLTLLAEDSIRQTTTVVVQGIGTLDMEAVAGSIVMTNGAQTIASVSNIYYKAFQDIWLGTIIATQGHVAIQATLGSVLNGDGSVQLIAKQASIIATNGSIGTLGAGTSKGLITSVGTLAAAAGAGGMNIANGGDLIIGAVPAIEVQRVLADDTLAAQVFAPMNGLKTIDNGSIVLANVGKVQVQETVEANGTGKILLASQNGVLASNVISDSTITVNTNIASGSGSITLAAGNTVIQNPDGDISTFGGDIVVQASTGDIRMVDGALTETHGGSVLYSASSNVLVGGINASNGLVGLVAKEGWILDAGDSYTNVVAQGVQFLTPLGGVGVPTNAIETTVGSMAALAGNGGVRITESDDLEIGSVGPLSPNVVLPDDTLLSTNLLPALAGIIVSNGSILVETLDGSISVTSVVLNAGTGNILLEAKGSGRDIVVSNLVASHNGNISAIASNSVFQYGSIISEGVGSIDVDAGTGSIWMDDEASAIAASSVLRYHAASNVTIAGMIALSNTVSLIADRGSILDGGDFAKDVLAPNLRMIAYDAAGTRTNPLETLTVKLAARAGTGGVHVVNDTVLIVDTIDTVTVQRVLSDDSLVAISDAPLSDIVTTNGGGVSLETVSGSIIVLDGSSPGDQVGIDADGHGEIRLDANGSNSMVIIDASLLSDAGDICVHADGNIILNSNLQTIATGKKGAIALWADADGDHSGDYLQTAGKVKTQNGNIYIYGEKISMYKGSIQSFSGSISLKAAKNILLLGNVQTILGKLVVDGSSLKIYKTLRGGTVALRARTGSITGPGKAIGTTAVSLDAFTDIGTERDPFDVDAGILAAVTKRDDIFLNELNSAEAGPVSAINLKFGLPECASNMPTASARAQDGVHAADFLAFTVEDNLSGDVVEAGADAVVIVNGSVTGLDLLKAGGNIDLTVRGSYTGNEILAGGNLNAEIGGTLRFDLIEADNGFVKAGDIYMSRVIIGNEADFRSTGTIFDDESYVQARDLIMTAREDIGPNRAIQLNVQEIDIIEAGGDATFVQQKNGDTLVNRLKAGGRLDATFEQGGILDRNGLERNILATSAIVDSRHMGTLTDPLEVGIGAGNLQVNGAGLSGKETTDDYIFVHLNGEIGKQDTRKIDYVGDVQIPGFIIFNGQVLGGKDFLLRRFARAYAFLTETPAIIRPEGYLGQPWFITAETPTTESWEIFIHYILRGQAEIGSEGVLPTDAAGKVRIGRSSKPFDLRRTSASAK